MQLKSLHSTLPHVPLSVSVILTLGVAAICEILAPTPFNLLNPAAFLITILVFITFQDGLAAGLLNAGLSLLYLAYYFATPSRSLQLTGDTLRQLIIWLISFPLIVVMVASLKRRLDRETRKLYEQVEKGQNIARIFDIRTTIVRNMSEGVCLVRAADGIIVWANPTFERMFGYGTGELAGKPGSITNYRDEATDPEVVARDIMDRTAQAGEADTVVHSVKKDGTAFWCRVRTALIDHPEYGKVCITLQEDITEQWRTEQALQESEMRYRAFLEIVPGAIIVADSAGRIVLGNGGAETLFGYGHDELTGLSIETLVPERSRARHPAQRAAYLADPKTRPLGHGFDLMGLRKDGTEFPVEIGLGYTVIDGAALTLAFITDTTERKRSADALERERYLLRTLIDSLPDSIFVKDAEGRYVVVNSAYARSLHAAVPEELLGKTVFDVFSPELAAQYHADDKQVVQSGESQFNLERMVADETGQRQWVLASKVPLRDATGQVTGLVGIVHDITESKRAENALRESETKFRRFVEQSSEGIVLTDEDGMITEWNRSQEHITGLRRADALGHPLWEIQYRLAPVQHSNAFTPEQLKDMLLDFLRTGGASWALKPMDNEIQHVDGTVRAVQAVVFPIQTDKGYIGASVLRDNTERKLAEQALRLSEERFSKVFHASPVTISITTRLEGRYVDVNDSWLRQSGYSRSEVIGRTSADIGMWPSSDFRGSLLDKLEKQGAIREMELKFRTKSGKTLDALLSIEPIVLNGEECLLHLASDITERKRAEEQLRKLSRAVEQSPISVVITNTRGDIEYVNPKFTQLSGYAASEVLGKNPRVLKSGETPLETYQQLWAAITAGDEWRGEFHNRKKNGELYWESARISPIKDAEGKITHFLAVKEDITARKQVEAALRQAEERFARAFHASPIGIVILTFNQSRVLDANASFLRMTGYSREEVIDRKATDLKLWVGSGSETELGRALWERQSIHDLETRFRTKTGEVRVGIVSLELVELGGEPCVLALIDDITERIEAEVALRTSEARFRLLFENSPVAIAIIRDGTCLFANRALAYLFGCGNVSELIGHAFADRIAPDSRAEIVQKLDDSAETLPISLDSDGLHKDGSLFHIHLDIGLIPLADGPAYVVFVDDLTERLLLEEEIVRAETLRVELEKGKELLELKDRFTSMVSHEFRTPLTVIRMSSELMEHFPNRFSEERKIKFLQEMQAQVQYMTQLLDDVLTIGKAKASKLDFNPVPIDAQAFTQSLVEQLQLADAGVHNFAFVAEGDLAPVRLDEQLLRHILVNLLSNALKYSPPGTEVALEVGRESGQIVFRIRDQGIGIPKTDLDHLFEAFHRAKNAAKIQGTGLGLAIVKANVETHGGTITCDSQEGKGTTFTVRLPVNGMATRRT